MEYMKTSVEGVGNEKVRRSSVSHAKEKYMEVSVELDYFWLCDLLCDCCAGNQEWIRHHKLNQSRVFV